MYFCNSQKKQKAHYIDSMDKSQNLLEKLYLLVQEIDKAKEIVDEEKVQYLSNYENRIEILIKRIQYLQNQ